MRDLFNVISDNSIFLLVLLTQYLLTVVTLLHDLIDVTDGSHRFFTGENGQT